MQSSTLEWGNTTFLILFFSFYFSFFSERGNPVRKSTCLFLFYHTFFRHNLTPLSNPLFLIHCNSHFIPLFHFSLLLPPLLETLPRYGQQNTFFHSFLPCNFFVHRSLNFQGTITEVVTNWILSDRIRKILPPFPPLWISFSLSPFSPLSLSLCEKISLCFSFDSLFLMLHHKNKTWCRLRSSSPFILTSQIHPSLTVLNPPFLSISLFSIIYFSFSLSVFFSSCNLCLSSCCHPSHFHLFLRKKYRGWGGK